jgi:tRNA(Ile)-lysidine synthase TilS/MesJ
MEKDANYQICTKCIYDTKVPKITFDQEGVCNYCKMIDDLKIQYKTATPEGIATFMSIVEKIKKDGKGKKYDCIVGVSGGTDSSYMIVKAL